MKIIQAVIAIAIAAIASASSDAQGQDEYLRGPSAVAAAITADVVVEDDTPRPVVVIDKDASILDAPDFKNKYLGADPTLEAGTACDSASDCESDEYCDWPSSSYDCVPKMAAGEDCMYNVQCLSNSCMGPYRKMVCD